MADLPGGLTPTRSAFLELKDEHRLIEEGYEFLDEKRMLLAAEILRRLAAYQALRGEIAEGWERARETLGRACGRHGLDGLSVLPGPTVEDVRWQTAHRGFLGVELLDGSLSFVTQPSRRPAANPSPEALQCADAFRAIIDRLGELALAEASLIRLTRDYVRTERRARALENVLLPELDDQIKAMDEALEALDQEEAVRVRCARPRQ